MKIRDYDIDVGIQVFLGCLGSVEVVRSEEQEVSESQEMF